MTVQLDGQAVVNFVINAADVVPTFAIVVPTVCKVSVTLPLPISDTALSRSLTADFVASTSGL